MKLYINEKNRKGHIEPEIYGHFSEHLGRCIYEGIYVGEDSPIPTYLYQTQQAGPIQDLQV